MKASETLTDSLDGTVLSAVAYSIIGTGADGRINLFSRGAERLLGYTAAEVVGKATTRLFDDPQTLERHQARARARLDNPIASGDDVLAAAASPQGIVEEHEWAYIRKDGSVVPVMLSLCALQDASGAFAGYLGLAYDISARHVAERALRQNEEKFRSLFEVTPFAITLHRLTDGRILEANAAFLAMTGYEREDLRELAFSTVALLPGDGGETSLVPTPEGTPAFGPLEGEFVRKDGSRVPVILTGACVSGTGSGPAMWSMAEDITHRKRLEAQLRRAAHRDPLTGLPNRALLHEQLVACERASSEVAGFRFALLHFDIDRFQAINEGLGHQAGDLLLIEVAKRLGATLRAEDPIARGSPDPAAHLGGDEFVILLRGIRGDDDARRVAERVRGVLERPYTVRGRDLSISFSIGIVLSGLGSDSPEEMLSAADSAMCEAKFLGRSRCIVFDGAMRQRVRHRMALRNDLRLAVEMQQLNLVYQPLMDLQTGAIAGCETLVRWSHPRLGSVSPAEFIPIAEESGLILELGEWVLRAAIQEYGEWRRHCGDLAPDSVSVNISRAQLILDDLAPKVESMLTSSGVDPWRLHLEITETAVMQDLEQGLRTLHALRQIGVKLDLDDFGTGYSSLASLHQLPLDVIKIDSSFVQRLETDRTSAALIEAVLSLAAILDLKVIAEGIETPRQLEQLQAMGCHLGQGYLFTQPLASAEFVEFLLADASLDGSALRSAAALIG